MHDKKILEQVVFDIAIQKYNASLKPYGTNVGPPVITTTDTTVRKIEALTN